MVSKSFIVVAILVVLTVAAVVDGADSHKDRVLKRHKKRRARGSFTDAVINAIAGRINTVKNSPGFKALVARAQKYYEIYSKVKESDTVKALQDGATTVSDWKDKIDTANDLRETWILAGDSDPSKNVLAISKMVNMAAAAFPPGADKLMEMYAKAVEVIAQKIAAYQEAVKEKTLDCPWTEMSVWAGGIPLFCNVFIGLQAKYGVDQCGILTECDKYKTQDMGNAAAAPLYEAEAAAVLLAYTGKLVPGSTDWLPLNKNERVDVRKFVQDNADAVAMAVYGMGKNAAGKIMPVIVCPNLTTCSM